MEEHKHKVFPKPRFKFDYESSNSDPCYIRSCPTKILAEIQPAMQCSHAVLVKAGEVGKQKGAATIFVGNINRNPSFCLL